MSLITCPDCKKEISASAKSCPHCGHDLSLSRGGSFGCFAFILGSAVVGYFGARMLGKIGWMPDNEGGVFWVFFGLSCGAAFVIAKIYDHDWGKSSADATPSVTTWITPSGNYRASDDAYHWCNECCGAFPIEDKFCCHCGCVYTEEELADLSGTKTAGTLGDYLHDGYEPGGDCVEQCPHCNKQNLKEYTICSHCGRRLG